MVDATSSPASGRARGISHLGPVYAHRDRADVAGAVLAHAEQRAAPAVAEDGIVRIAGVAARALVVRSLLVDGVRQRVVEEELAGVDDVAAEVDLDVDVYRAAHVPAGVDGLEDREAGGVRLLDPAHERLPDLLLDARVGAARVGVPDVDRGALDRPAGRGVEHG